MRPLDLKPGVRVPSSPCPHCGAEPTGASGVNAHYPKPGDVAICIDCAGVNTYGRDLRLVAWPAGKPIPAEVQAVQARVRELRS